MRHVNGPGSPGELFVEGERFNIQRFYQNQTSAAALNHGRIYTPDVPFDPFSIRNIALATMTGVVTNPATRGFTTIGKPGYSITIPFPVSPEVPHKPARRWRPTRRTRRRFWASSSTIPRIESPCRASWFSVIGHGYSVWAPKHPAMNKTWPSRRQHRRPRWPWGNARSPSQQAAQQDILIGQELEAIRLANLNLEQRLAMDVQFLDATNDGINLFNDRTLPVLKAITGQDLGVEPEKWKGWWTDQLGYVYESDIPDNQADLFRLSSSRAVAYTHSACFAAGTLVQTVDGPRPIESIRVGDSVLSQGTSTGTLAFQPVVAIHRNQPAATLRINIGGESIVATGIHRFWKAGKGWTMARELKAGDRLRMVGGTVAIESIDADKAQPVYNLDVAENRDFFVGTNGLLVHDFSFVQPVLEPFDRQAELAPQVPLSKRK